MFIFRTIFFIVHLALLVLLFAIGFNAYWQPKWGAWLNLLSLAFPFLFVLYFLLNIYWVFNFRKRGIIFLAGFVFLIPLLQRWVNYSTPNEKLEPNIKVMSFNTHGVSPEKQDYLNNIDADILLLQESGWATKNKMKLPKYRHTAHSEVVSIYSKFPILRQEKIKMSENAYAQYADIQVDGRGVRLLNIYLEPFRLEKEELKPSESMDINKIKAKSLMSRMMPVFKIHQTQIDEVKKYIETSPYPVILAGDFNAVPNSYEYYQLREGLKDAFVEAGKGSGTTFHDYAMPIRIDYIFATDHFKPISYQVDRSVKLSDHYPVFVELSLK